MQYGSRVPRHGNARRCRRYHGSSRRWSSCFMSGPDRIRAAFVKMVQQPEPAIDLAKAALLVAAESDPNVDVDGELRTIEGWAEELRRRLDPEWNNLQKLARLRS